jgi:hypothetical protein
MEQRMAVPEAERRDQAVDGSSNRMPLRPKLSIVPGGINGQLDAAGREHFALEQFSLNGLKVVVLLHTFQAFAEYEVGDTQAID